MTFEKLGTYAAVSISKGCLYSLAFDGFDSDTFIYYLRWLLKVLKTTKKIVLVLDNASSHKSHKVKDFVAKHQRRLALLYLPAYLPDLNPIERVWKHLRYQVSHNIYFESLKALEDAITSYLKSIFNQTKH